MSSDGGVGGVAAGPLDVAPGECVLADTAASPRPRELLPPSVGGDLLVVTTASPTAVARSLDRRDVDPARAGMLPIGTGPVDRDDRLWCGESVAPDDVEGLREALTRTIGSLPPGAWVLLESVEALFLFADGGRTESLLARVADGARERGLRCVVGLDGRVLDDRTYDRLVGRLDRAVARP